MVIGSCIHVLQCSVTRTDLGQVSMSLNLIHEIIRMDQTCASFCFGYFVLPRLFEKRFLYKKKCVFNKYKSYKLKCINTFFLLSLIKLLCKSKHLKFIALYEFNKKRILLVNYTCSFF